MSRYQAPDKTINLTGHIMEIALAFSGGGYRASAFNLGVLTYLDRAKLSTGDTLLSHVTTLSTVSGGTITGAKYALGIKKGETLQDVYASLYDFFLNTDLITKGVARLQASAAWPGTRVKSVINAFADLYDEHLFHRDKFGVLFDAGSPIHLKHISFNATEFSTGLQFRFQISPKIKSSTTGRFYRGVIGNQKNSLSPAIARELRMADILAASSCFPGGFEPINFPNDFVLPPEAVREYRHRKTIGLMDGGIVDNQGIEPVLHAEKRMQGGRAPGDESNVLDLIIVSDVSSPYMKAFTASEQKKENWWRRLTIRRVRTTAWSVFAVSLPALAASFIYKWPVAGAFAAASGTVATLVLLLFWVAFGRLKKIQAIDMRKVTGLLNLKLQVVENLVVNRVKSVMKLTGSVYMKRIRKLNFHMIWDDEAWENRRIMNAIYSLRAGETMTKERFDTGELDQSLWPSKKVQEVSRVAAGMDTTLWFEQKHRDNNALDALIACGQYTMCWNLLGYIAQLKRHNKNTNEKHAAFLRCEPQLKADWEKFQENPYWLVEEYAERQKSNFAKVD